MCKCDCVVFSTRLVWANVIRSPEVDFVFLSLCVCVFVRPSFVQADPTPAESVVNGVNGNAEKVVKGLEAEGEEEKDNQSEEKPAEVEAKEDGEVCSPV